MTVRISKPTINVAEKLAELDKPTGIAGEAMLRAETPQEQFNLIGAGRRNAIINGAINVSQRGDYTSATSWNSGNFYLDRYELIKAGVNSTVQQTTVSIQDVPSQYAQKLVATSSATGYMAAQQKIEDYAFFANQTITVSAWVRANTSQALLVVYDGSWKGVVNHSGGGGWEKLSTTVSVASGPSELRARIGVIDDAQNGNLAITSGDFIEFTNLQLELGKVATPFEYRSYGEELALCQRYYCKTYSDGTAVGTATSTGAVMSAAYTSISYASAGTWFFPVEMRTAPTTTIYSTANANTTGKVTADSTDGTGAVAYIGTNSAVIYRNNDNTGVGASVFVRAHATADAEL